MAEDPNIVGRGAGTGAPPSWAGFAEVVGMARGGPDCAKAVNVNVANANAVQVILGAERLVWYISGSGEGLSSVQR